MPNSVSRFTKSFTHALHGLVFLFRSQVNAQIELCIAVSVIIAAAVFRISSSEWIQVLLCIAMVLGLEGINTSIEILADKLHPGFDDQIGKVKDVAAGAVLIASILAATIGFIIFVPRILDII